MDYLLNYNLTKEDLNFIHNHYSEAMLSNIILKKDNVINIINILKEKEFDVKYLLLNRLDIFLIDIEDFKNKINRFTSEELELLRDDFSMFC